MGWENSTLQVLLITGAPGSGILIYNPAPALGALIGSGKAAPGTDTYGNAFLQGFASYNLLTFQAASLTSGAFTLSTAPGFGGPWTTKATLGIAGGAVSLTAAAGSALPVSIAADTGQAISLLNAVSFIASALGNTFWQALVTGDTNPRAILDTTGAGVLRLRFGPGNAAPDINIARSAAGLLNITVPGVTSLLTSDLDIATIGKGLQIAEGSNARMGVATLAAGTVTVSNTSVTANTRIFLTSQTTGAAPGTPRVSARTAGTSFTITSTSGTDTSQVAWLLIEPG